MPGGGVMMRRATPTRQAGALADCKLKAEGCKSRELRLSTFNFQRSTFNFQVHVRRLICGSKSFMNPQTQLLAGTGRRCINPPPNIAHGGWGAQKHEQAEGIDLDLWATALALSDGANTALILDVDIQILTNERADQIRTAVSKATGVPMHN